MLVKPPLRRTVSDSLPAASFQADQRILIASTRDWGTTVVLKLSFARALHDRLQTLHGSTTDVDECQCIDQGEFSARTRRHASRSVPSNVEQEESAPTGSQVALDSVGAVVQPLKQGKQSHSIKGPSVQRPARCCSVQPVSLHSAPGSPRLHEPVSRGVQAEKKLESERASAAPGACIALGAEKRVRHSRMPEPSAARLFTFTEA
ncbi:hypothetical protein MRX96_058513 [Rhipicephalus microplus]